MAKEFIIFLKPLSQVFETNETFSAKSNQRIIIHLQLPMVKANSVEQRQHAQRQQN